MANSIFKNAGVTTISTKNSGMTASVKIGGSLFEGVVCQSVDATVGTQIQTVYEVGSRNAHRFIGRVTGQGTIANIIGPTKASLSTMTALCDVCTSKDLEIEFPNNCSNKAGTPSALIFKDCTCTSLTCRVDSQNDMINGQWSVIFSDVQN